MKKYKIILCVLIFKLLMLSTIPVYAITSITKLSPIPNMQNGYWVMDTDSITSLPKRYRIIPSLNISGSAQFDPSQVDNLRKEINILDTYIVDLRQESHGFLNNNAVSFYSPYKLLNNGFTSEETLLKEKELFNKIKYGDIENIFNKRGAFKTSIDVYKSQIELNLVKEVDFNYILFATRDGHIPSPSITDSFVDFVKKTPATTHLHFHCDHGEGRTTMFMAMFQMMKESTFKTLEEILAEQLKAGGIVLTTETSRATFLQDFYQYTKENAESNFKTPFSIWTQKNSTSTF